MARGGPAEGSADLTRRQGAFLTRRPLRPNAPQPALALTAPCSRWLPPAEPHGCALREGARPKSAQWRGLRRRWQRRETLRAPPLPRPNNHVHRHRRFSAAPRCSAAERCLSFPGLLTRAAATPCASHSPAQGPRGFLKAWGGVQYPPEHAHPASCLSRVELGSLVIDIEGDVLTAAFVNADGRSPDRWVIDKRGADAAAAVAAEAAEPEAEFEAEDWAEAGAPSAEQAEGDDASDGAVAAGGERLVDRKWPNLGEELLPPTAETEEAGTGTSSSQHSKGDSDDLSSAVSAGGDSGGGR